MKDHNGRVMTVAKKVRDNKTFIDDAAPCHAPDAAKIAERLIGDGWADVEESALGEFISALGCYLTDPKLVSDIQPVVWAFNCPGEPYKYFTTNPDADNLKKESLIPLYERPPHPVPEITQWPMLKAMSKNYTPGKHVWDKLDADACAKAADEIKALRALWQSDKEDAARYRFLRDQTHALFVFHPVAIGRPEGPFVGEKLDEVVDIARARGRYVERGQA